jgi:hypothetical protein
VVDDNGDLKGLITVKDIQKARRYPSASKDPLGRLRCGAAVGVGKEGLERASALIDAKVDVIVIDSAHAHSAGVMDLIRSSRRSFRHAADRRERRHGRGGAGSHRARRRRPQGRHRAGLDLHHARGGRRWSSSADGVMDCARRREVRHSDHQRRRDQVLGRHHQGDRRRRQCVMIGSLLILRFAQRV